MSELILLVDDDRLVLSALAPMLQEAGYEVLTASGGKQATDLGNRSRFDLIVLDMQVPGMDGIALAAKLRGAGRTPIIFLSAYADEQTIESAVAEGAVGYLVKPVDQSQLLAAVRAGLLLAHEWQVLQLREEQLSRALSGDRTINTAVGVLMTWYRLDEKAAFDKLRSYARSHRRKLSEVSRELVESIDSRFSSDNDLIERSELDEA